MRRVTDRIRRRLGKGVEGTPFQPSQLTSPIASLPLELRNESDAYVYNEIFLNHEYDSAIIDLLRDSTGSGTVLVLDIGANVGFFSARLIELATAASFDLTRLSITMVEGSPSVVNSLRSRKWLQPGDQKANINIVHGLVGARTGEGEIAEVDFYARNTMKPEHNSGFADVATMPRHIVPYIDLETLVPADQRVGLLKVDVEGSEESLLTSYSEGFLQRTDSAILELHHKLCDVANCERLLAAAGLNKFQTCGTTDTTSLVRYRR